MLDICPASTYNQSREFENLCREDPGIALGDESMKIILNTKGTIGEISQELEALLRYMDGQMPDSDYTRALDRAVTGVRRDEKWRREYMVMNELLRENRRLGQRERSVAQIRKFRNRFDPNELAEICFISPEILLKIQNAIDAHPDWDDETVAENVEFE